MSLESVCFDWYFRGERRRARMARITTHAVQTKFWYRVFLRLIVGNVPLAQLEHAVPQLPILGQNLILRSIAIFPAMSSHKTGFRNILTNFDQFCSSDLLVDKSQFAGHLEHTKTRQAVAFEPNLRATTRIFTLRSIPTWRGTYPHWEELPACNSPP